MVIIVELFHLRLFGRLLIFCRSLTCQQSDIYLPTSVGPENQSIVRIHPMIGTAQSAIPVHRTYILTPTVVTLS